MLLELSAKNKSHNPSTAHLLGSVEVKQSPKNRTSNSLFLLMASHKERKWEPKMSLRRKEKKKKRVLHSTARHKDSSPPAFNSSPFSPATSYSPILCCWKMKLLFPETESSCGISFCIMKISLYLWENWQKLIVSITKLVRTKPFVIKWRICD